MTQMSVAMNNLNSGWSFIGAFNECLYLAAAFQKWQCSRRNKDYNQLCECHFQGLQRQLREKNLLTVIQPLRITRKQKPIYFHLLAWAENQIKHKGFIAAKIFKKSVMILW